MPLDGRQLSIGNALALAYARGFTGGQRLITSVSVMSAESARYTRAFHVNDDGSIDRGIWQINNVAHPDLDDGEAYDPRQATSYAHQLYREQGFRPWSAYNSGAYLKYWPVVAAVWAFNAWRLKVGKWSV